MGSTLPDWISELNKYMAARDRANELEETYERHYDTENFGCSCDECKDHDKSVREMNRLVAVWGHTWAFRLSEAMKRTAHA